MDASSYTQRALTDDQRTHLKVQAVPILELAGFVVPSMDKWTITDHRENDTKIMLGPAMGYHSDPEARELRGIFIDLKRKRILSLSNNPVIKCVDELSMDHLTELIKTGNTISCYPRAEILQLRLIYAPDEDGVNKIYLLSNKSIDASNMTWSRSATFFSMLQSAFGIQELDDFIGIFEGRNELYSPDQPQHDMSCYQYDLVIHNSALTNVGQIPQELFEQKVYVPRIRIAGTDITVSQWTQDMTDLFAHPTPISIDRVFAFYKYGYYYDRNDDIKATIDKLLPYERPADGVYVDIMTADRTTFVGSVVFTTPAFEFRTKLLKTSKLDDTRICADVEKLWYMRIDGDPMLLPADKRQKALSGWLSKPPTYARDTVNGKPRPPKTPLFGPRDATHVANDDNLPPWMPGGIKELDESERVKLYNQVMKLYEQGRYEDISAIYRLQAEYALRVAVSPARRYIVSSLNTKMDKNIDLIANKLAHASGKGLFSRSNRNATIQAIYRPNRKEEDDAMRAVDAIFLVLNMKETITHEHILKAATGAEVVIPNANSYPRPRTADDRIVIIRAILKAMGKHKFFKLLCLCQQV